LNLDKKLDLIWANTIKKKGECEYCGATTYLNAHHLFSRSNRTLRWDLNNGICLCSSHHALNSSFSAHKAPLEFHFWLIDYKGLDFINDLREAAKEKFTMKKKDKEELFKKLSNEF
jgi:hypothetical protein